MKPSIQLLAFLLLIGCATYGDPVTVSDSILTANTKEMSQLVAMRYGLVVNDTLDERQDEEAATRAAQRYLDDLHAMFGDWDLAYCAFLYGPAYVRSLQIRGRELAPPEKPVIKKTSPAPKPKTTASPQRPKTIIYTVKSGDTLSGIAKRYHVKVSDLKRWNNLRGDLIQINQKLRIYL